MAHDLIRAPRTSAGDGAVRLVEWRAADGQRVRPGDAIAVFETSKATFELEAERAGFLFHAVSAGSQVDVGAPIGAIADAADRPSFELAAPASEMVVTGPARALIEQHGLSATDFAGLQVVRRSDVEARLGARVADSDALLRSDAFLAHHDLLTKLRARMRSRFDGHVATGDLLVDRWELARELGFGKSTSIYDSSLVLGDVRVGAHCWIGPFTVLDGAHAPLVIGDRTQIGSGSQIYTHHTIRYTLSGGALEPFKAPTTIGRCCFISPMSVIGPGSEIADQSFVASGSYVEGRFPPRSYLEEHQRSGWGSSRSRRMTCGCVRASRKGQPDCGRGTSSEAGAAHCLSVVPR
jgi:acetyltransferase-like isoleucine patch superfamily enzyme